MKAMKVTMVRVYITEASGLLKKLVQYLHDDANVRGVSVFRAMSGYGNSKQVHDSSLVDLSLNLPLTIEFFDSPEKIDKVLAHLNLMVKPEHIVFWDAQTWSR